MKQRAIEQLLPEVFQRGLSMDSPLDALLGVMEVLHQPDEEVLAGIERFYNPYQAPDAFALYLANWLDLRHVFAPTNKPDALAAEPSSGIGRLRNLLANAAYLSKWRGTAHGLARFLEISTGVDGFEIDEHVLDNSGQERPFHLRVTVPPEAEAHLRLVQRIVETEKPAYVTHEIVLTGAGA